MMRCWSRDIADRPSFQSLYQTLRTFAPPLWLTPALLKQPGGTRYHDDTSRMDALPVDGQWSRAGTLKPQCSVVASLVIQWRSGNWHFMKGIHKSPLGPREIFQSVDTWYVFCFFLLLNSPFSSVYHKCYFYFCFLLFHKRTVTLEPIL